MRGGAVELRMLGAVVAHSVVGMPKIPERPWLDEFTAASAVDETGGDHRRELLARAPVKRQPILPVPHSLARLRVHPPIVVPAFLRQATRR